MEDDKKKKHFGASVIFWFAFALILLVAFLINRNKIIGILQRTAFFTKVFGTEPAFVMNYTPADDEPVAELSSSATEEPYAVQEPVITIVPKNNRYVSDIDDTLSLDAKADVADNADAVEADDRAAASDAQETSAVDATKNADTSVESGSSKDLKITPSVQPVQTPDADSTPKMTQHLCFVVISGDGSVLRKEIERTIPKTITPLTAAINALLAGPSIDELEKGYMTLIPEDTELLGASVKDGVASINFSSEFRFNKYGVEGYYGQLAQIVYTATAFSNINSVQFLIEGEKIDYLSEGVFIGAPLSRTSLY